MTEESLSRFDVGAEPAQFSKRCYKCDEPVKMSGPAFVQDPQWFTVCRRCRDIVQAEAKFAGE